MPKEAGAIPAARSGAGTEKLRHVRQGFYKGLPPGTEVVIYGYKLLVVDDNTAAGDIPEDDVNNMVDNGCMVRA